MLKYAKEVIAMLKKKTCEVNMGNIDAFAVNINYVECKSSDTIPDERHLHDECEIYINLSGDLAFEVEGLVYPIFPGSVIVTMPGEKHQCLYRSNALHKHYCIWFSTKGNEKLFPWVFEREKGEKNMYALSPSVFSTLIIQAERLINASREVEKIAIFFSIIETIFSSDENIQPYGVGLPEDVALAVTYINGNIGMKVSVAELAEHSGVNITTLERHFYSVFRMTPAEYIKTRRLNDSAQLLKDGSSVTEACFECGFSDLSKYISLFKKQFGITPKQYQKENRITK